ncbi:MAG: TetR family transcriptional regulator [Proteobacteria bacterium]|nr:TetR family transcriptional regulator [Pseudomonadota bacterium]
MTRSFNLLDPRDRILIRTKTKRKSERGIRAILDDEKLARENDFIEGALTLFLKEEYSNIGVLDICKQIGLAKGSFYLYFHSKEEVFLRIVEQQIVKWGQLLDQKLSELPTQCPLHLAAKTFVSSLSEFSPMLRLFSLLHSIIEKNVRPERILPFKLKMLEVQSSQAILWKKIYPRLDDDDIQKLLIFLSSSLLGIWTLANPPESARAAIQLGGLEKILAPFGSTLESQLEMFLKGLQAKHV